MIRTASFALLVSLTLAVACSDGEEAAPGAEPGGASSGGGGSSGTGSDGAAPGGDGGTLADATPDDDRFVPPPSEDAILLEEIQRATFRYFWDFAHPASGMARERSTSGDIVTSGGTGFGIEAIVVGVSRGWITRAEALARLQLLVGYLATADRFHGAWSHWLHGGTGRAVPFSLKDNGGDLVETSFLIHGLLVARQFFDGADPAETALRQGITTLWEGVEWSHYATKGDGRLYWHWSPNYGWDMNLRIAGYNEALITHVLALASPTHPISQAVYDTTWTHAGYRNRATYQGYQLPLGPNLGGPLFFEHYTLMVLDPRKLADTHASYWLQGVVHTRINRAYCLQSAPANYGYGPQLWGLTASDNPDGYDAHSPTNDNGTIAPTAALSSMPFTPHESLEVARHLRSLGAQAFGEYGFVDALNPSRNWYDTQTIAIDQGPIVAMIENYRSGLLWDLFMRVPEVRTGLTRARIAEPEHATGFYLAIPDATDGRVHLVRHPDRRAYELDVAIHDAGAFSLVVETPDGVDVNVLWNAENVTAGTRVMALGDLPPGPYTVQLTGPGVSRTLAIQTH